MSKPKRRVAHLVNEQVFVMLEADETLTLPEIIEGRAKGYVRKHLFGNWMLQVKKHKPQHTKGRKTRFYYVHDPKKRPLVTW